MLWVMRHRWEHLLFAHWPLAPARLQALLPHGLVPDVFEGNAWVAVVPFQLSFWPRGIPALERLAVRFTELNLRTYVRPANQPNGPAGVYFFTLDASDPFSVEMARLTYQLAYCHAQSTLRQDADGWLAFKSVTTDKRGKPATVSLRYRPLETPLAPDRKPLLSWLTERYRLYSTDAQHRVWTAQLAHPAWSLKNAEAEWHINTLPQAYGFGELDSLQPPLLHYARSTEVKAGLPRRV